MKIFEFSPFFKENLIAKCHIQESIKWVDEYHIVETNYKHQYSPKEFYFDLSLLQEYSKLHYHKVDVSKLFKPKRKYIPYLQINPRKAYLQTYFRNSSWYNEGLQRNLAHSFVDIGDDDIVIFSDIDEIIDPRKIDWLIENVKKRGPITIKIYFTLFYFNLFSQNWGGPPDYSYRITLMKGSTFKKRFYSDSDRLRKLGEHGCLYDIVYCPDEILGFHHSWIVDENSISEKLLSYAHTEHQYLSSKDYIRTCLKEKRSIFPGQILNINNEIPLLDSVDKLRDKEPQYFV